MTGDPKTVTVVDDDDGVRKALGRLLRAHGYRVIDYASAADFLEDATEHSGCMILDVQMPGLDGLSLQEEIESRGIDLPIVFITAHGDVPKSVRAMKHGAVDFLEKPFDESDLLRAISTAFSGSEQKRAEAKEREKTQERIKQLTPRENEVFVRVTRGALNREIAAELGVSVKTVKAHRARVMRKMEAESLAHLVRMAERLNI